MTYMILAISDNSNELLKTHLKHEVMREIEKREGGGKWLGGTQGLWE